MRGFKTIQGGGDLMQRMQDNVGSALNPLLSLPIVDGTLLTGIVLKAGKANPVSHKLSRRPLLWMLADQDTNCNVWRTAWDESLLTLSTSHDCTIALWVA